MTRKAEVVKGNDLVSQKIKRSTNRLVKILAAISGKTIPEWIDSIVTKEYEEKKHTGSDKVSI